MSSPLRELSDIVQQMGLPWFPLRYTEPRVLLGTARQRDAANDEFGGDGKGWV